MKFQVRLTGFKEIDSVLRGLSAQVNHQIVSQAIAAASKPLINEEKTLAPSKTGKLKESIGAVKSTYSKARSLGETTIGPRRHGRFRGNVAHLLETGTKQRKILGLGRYRSGKRGRITARPFVLPAYESKRQIVLDGINGFIGLKLYQYMRRVIRK